MALTKLCNFAANKGIKPGDCLGCALGDEMCIGVEGHSSRTVAKGSLQRLYRATTGQHIGSEEVSQTVNCDVSEARTLECSVEVATGV